jgi:hypothetical protein
MCARDPGRWSATLTLGLLQDRRSSPQWKFSRPDTASAGGRAHFLSSAGQFVTNVMDVDLVWSVVWTTNCTVLRADVVEMADVRMIQRGNGAGFALKALLEFGIVGEMSGENLDGDSAIEARVFRPVDFSHTAGAERGLNFVRPEFSARR